MKAVRRRDDPLRGYPYLTSPLVYLPSFNVALDALFQGD